MKNHLIAWLATAGLSASGVFVWVKAHKGGLFKGIKIGLDILNILRQGLDAAEDDKISADEEQQILALVKELKKDLKS